MSRLRQINSFFERFWLVIGIGSAIYGVYYVSTYGMTHYKYLVYPLFAFGLWGARYVMRKRIERQEREHNEQSS